MALSKEKVTQAYIEALVEVVKAVKAADTKAQAFKTLFVAKNPDLSGTNISQAQIDAVNQFLVDLNKLSTSVVATTIINKSQPSHGTKALE